MAIEPENDKQLAKDETVVEGEPVSQDTEMWAAIGHKLLEESIEVSREYAKFMIQFSFGAIPIYISLLGLVGKNTSSLRSLNLRGFLLVISPVFLFIIASLLFILAYYPKSGELIVNVSEIIKDSHQDVIRRRRKINLVATVVFSSAVLLSASILLIPT